MIATKTNNIHHFSNLEPPYSPSMRSSNSSMEISCSHSNSHRQKKTLSHHQYYHNDPVVYKPVPMSPHSNVIMSNSSFTLDQLLTWGEIEYTPTLLSKVSVVSQSMTSNSLIQQQRLDNNSKEILQEWQRRAYLDEVTDAPKFMMKPPQRELLGRSLADSIQRKYSKSKHIAPSQQVKNNNNSVNLTIEKANSSHNVKKFANLTPAAQSLALKLQSQQKLSNQITTEDVRTK